MSPAGLDAPDLPVLQLSPLYLPVTGRPYDPDDGGDGEGGADAPEYDVFGTRRIDSDRVFWYRWITGHQISFVVWRLMHEVLDRHPDEVPGPAELALLTMCVDAYSAVLLYSSTVPRATYHRTIRHRMSLQHPAFSGTWAPDYRPVRRIFRGKVPWQEDAACADLAAAVGRNAATHDYIADHLVPAGRSLLQQSVRTPGVSVSREKEELYDNFFLTVRRPVGRARLLAQLRSRTEGVGVDLAHHGLYPNVEGHHHPVVTGRTGGVMMKLVPTILRVLDDTTRLAARTALEGVSA